MEMIEVSVVGALSVMVWHLVQRRCFGVWVLHMSCIFIIGDAPASNGNTGVGKTIVSS